MFDVALHAEAAAGEIFLPSAAADFFKPQVQLVEGPLSHYLKALLAVHVAPLPPTTLSIIPHDHAVLTVHMGPRVDGFDCDDAPGMSVKLTALRDVRGTTHPPGNCLTLFAILTPAGVIQLLHGQALDERARLRAPLAAALGMAAVRRLEDALRMYMRVEDKLACLGHWLEQQFLAPRGLSVQAQRTARAASRLMFEPLLPVSALAAQEHVSPRQLERDFHKWLLVSPKQFSQVVRVQHAARLARRGWGLSRVAAEMGYADQAHMSRAVKTLAGVAPQRLLRGVPHPMARAFSAATRGGIVYL